MQVGTTKDQGLYNKPPAAVHPGALAVGTLPQYNTNIPMTTSGIEPATFRLVAQFLRDVLFLNNCRLFNSVPLSFHICIHKRGRQTSA